MKIVLLVIVLSFLPESKPPIDDGHCEFWKYRNHMTYMECKKSIHF